MEQRLKASLIGLVGLAILVSGCQKQGQTTNSTTTATARNNADNLAQETYHTGTAAVIAVNHGKSTLKASQWRVSRIDYGHLDALNRTTTDTAYLSQANLGRSDGRTAQTWRPTGWHNQPIMVNGQRVLPQNRGHLIAYTLSFNLNSAGRYQAGALGSLDNPKNLATQTAYANQKTMQLYEAQVRTALARGEKVIYRVTTVFRGNELMPRGYWSQAISTDGRVNFNVYIWNVEPGVSFDYRTGRGHADQRMRVVSPQSEQSGDQATGQRWGQSHSKQVKW